MSENVPLRVASFNLRYDTQKDGENAWPHRRDWVREILKQYDFHVFGAQEALRHMADFIAADGWEYVGVGRDDGKEAGEHAPIFYNPDRITCRDTGTLWLSPTPEIPSRGWDADLHRICTWAKLTDKATGQNFTFFNSHWDHNGEIARLESARLLLGRMPLLAGEEPYLLTGDFNLPPPAVPIRLVATVLRNARDAAEAPATGPVGTFNSYDPVTPPAGPIDYIFVSEGVRVLSFATLNEVRDGKTPSDHFPVAVSVVLG